MEIVVIDDMGEKYERCQICHRNPAEFRFQIQGIATLQILRLRFHNKGMRMKMSCYIRSNRHKRKLKRKHPKKKGKE